MSMKFPSSFTFNNNRTLITLCIMYIIKCIRNNLISNGFFLHCPSLTLSNDKALERINCDFKWTRKLHHAFKDELVVVLKIWRKDAHLNNLEKKNLFPALLVFSDQVTSALKENYGEGCKGRDGFLKWINYCIIKPFTTVSYSKSFRKEIIFVHHFLILLTKNRNMLQKHLHG